MRCLPWRLLLALGLMAGLAFLYSPARAADPASAKQVIVGVVPTPPFVTETPTGIYGGMAIDLWQDIAKSLGISYRYQPMPSFRALMDAVTTGKVDVVVSSITITKGRLDRMDFTQPWFDTGLRVMINKDRGQGFGGLVHELWITGHIRVYLWLAVAIVVATIILTLVDRHFDDEFHTNWWRGLADSFYHVMAIATSGRAAMHKPLFGGWGRVIAGFWMLCGVGVVAYVTSSITSVMTTASITNQISSVADLPGKTVGVVEGTVGEEYAVDAVLQARSFPTFQDAVDALLRHQIVAIIDDAATLEYFDNAHPELPLTEVGALFRPAKYGFATPRGSQLTRAISVAIVADQEDGSLGRLKARYFGVQP